MKRHYSKATGKAAFIIAGVAALALSLSRNADAVCSHTPENVFLTDKLLFPLHECEGGYVAWHWANMHIDIDDWKGRLAERVPVNDPVRFCDLPFEYAKVVNSSWLVAIQPHIPPEPSPPNLLFPYNRAFHGHDDYGPVIDGNDTDWHDELKYIAVDGYNGGIPGALIFGAFQPHPVAINELKTLCTVYDWEEPRTVPASNCGLADGCLPVGPKGPNIDDAVKRTSVLVHEGWHAWGEENYTSDFAKTQDPGTGHELAGSTAAIAYIQASSNPSQPNFCGNQLECDHFRPHSSREFPEGALLNAGRRTDAASGDEITPRPSTFHSVYQTQIEFECDVADYAAGFIPYSVREAAALLAKADATSNVVEGVPFFCGSTRPLWTKDPGAIPSNVVPSCLDQSRTDCGQGTNGNCGTKRGGCGPDGCCIPTCSNPVQQCTGLPQSVSCGTQCNVTSGCCVPPPVPLTVRGSSTQFGPDICIHGESFTPGSKVDIQYIGIPGQANPVFVSETALPGSDGKFDVKDKGQENAFYRCVGDEAEKQVEVDAVERNSVPLRTAKAMIPANLWCALIDYNGGCR